MKKKKETRDDQISPSRGFAAVPLGVFFQDNFQRTGGGEKKKKHRICCPLFVLKVLPSLCLALALFPARHVPAKYRAAVCSTTVEVTRKLT